MQILSSRKYPTPRNGLLSLEEIETRRLAYSIKSIASPSVDFDTAARAMAAVLLQSLNPLPSPPWGEGSRVRCPAFYSPSIQHSSNPSIQPIWLVPIPASDGNTDANTKLAFHIARYVPGAQIAKAIYRTQPVQSQCARHKLALGPIEPEQHHLARTRKMLTLRQTYFVDNVTTSGNTLEAARLALGFGAGLVFADAAPKRVQLQATLF
jgi:hypothetical protein